MSTFFVSFGVVAATIAGILYVVVNAPDQPATIRRQPSPAKPSRRQRSGDAPPGRKKVASGRTPGAAVAMGPTPALALPDSDVMRLRVLPAARTTLWVRIRSGVVLVVLVGVLGALLALAVGGAVLGLALLVRGATGA